ncbi:MAG: helix-turn-helix domain-containing protein [Mycobacterium kyogaense]|uniref:helix-turn-helix transcriptional regulator n=1 Tax=Mycobacterium kyogaense TaxID=2212479 RepID=UPI002FF6AA36
MESTTAHQHSNDRLLFTSEVAHKYGFSEPTLRWYRSMGIGPKSWKAGRRVRYRESDVLEWLAAQESKSARGGVA